LHLALIQLPQIGAFIPAYGTAMLVNDLITAVLLFAQFSILRSFALLRSRSAISRQRSSQCRGWRQVEVSASAAIDVRSAQDFEPSVPRNTTKVSRGLMSPLLEPPPTEKSARTTSDTTTPPGAFRGTDGSNRSPSSGESANCQSLFGDSSPRR
jgi:hypothetical protein